MTLRIVERTEFTTMTFNAFGRGSEQNSFESHSKEASSGLHHQINGNGSDAGNGNGGSNGTAEDHSSAKGNSPAPPPAVSGNAPARRLPLLRTTLSSGVSIKGTVKFRSECEIDGEVEGTICSLGRLTVGRNGRVRGDIQTRSVTVLGTVDGNLSVDEKCELRSGCTLRGDIETSRLVVDENVNFTGSAAIATRDYLSELRPTNGGGHK
jgi:cytoskeletal protein CcmA (bactofilin family)